MMSWGGSFVGRVEPPSKLVIWSGLRWGLEGLLGGKKKTGLILICLGDEKPGWCQTAAVLKLTVDQTSWLLAPLVLLPPTTYVFLLKSGDSLCVFLFVCISCLPSFCLCVPTRPRTPSKPAACCSTQLHTQAFKKTPSNPPPPSPKVSTAFPCGIYQRDRDYKGAYWPGVSCTL